MSYSRKNYDDQRLIFMILRIVLSVLLLSDISFQSTYNEVYDFPVLSAGLSPLNTTIGLHQSNFDSKVTAQFWWFYSSLLTDTQNVRTIEPLNCSGSQCSSYFMPGRAATIVSDPSGPAITTTNFTDALSLIQKDAPGYQIEFAPIQSVNQPMTLGDCHLYGYPAVAVQICLMKANSSFLAGDFPLNLRD